MDMVIFRTIFFELLVFFMFTILTLHSPANELKEHTKTRRKHCYTNGRLMVVQESETNTCYY